MSERYSKVFALSENLYATGSPIVIEAGALQKDNQTGGILAQLKMKNISAQVIKAVKVKLTLFDVAGNVLADGVEQQYLDLRVVRDESFGSKSAIKLKESTTRSFSVNITEVVFEDGSVWSGTANPWETLSKQTALINQFNDEELVKQFEITFGSPCHNVLLEEKDLWHCVCGALNKDNEQRCHKCGKSLKSLKELDISALQIAKDKRVKAERIAAEEKAERERKEAEIAKIKSNAIKKRSLKIAAVVSIVVIAVFIANTFIIPPLKYNKAISLMNNGEYRKAITIFESLNGYKDSASKIDDLEYGAQYNDAIILKNEGKYRKAIETFEALGDYKDSKQQIRECENLQNNPDALIEPEALEKANEIKAILQTCDVDDEVSFGRYDQDNDITNGAEDIEWIILNKDDGRMLLLSKYVLTSDMYGVSLNCTRWDKSNTRNNLNGAFYKAFDNVEKSIICSVENITSSVDTPEITTQEKVFLLSIEEVEKYLPKNKRSCESIPSMKKLAEEKNNLCTWMLRNPGKHENVPYNNGIRDTYSHVDYISYVDINGEIVREGKKIDDYHNIRPAIWVSLD